MMYGLKDKTLDDINKVFAQFSGLDKVVLYGSRAKGNFKNGSDIDLTLIGKNLDLSIKYKIELALDDLFLPHTFDINLFHQLNNDELIEYINRVGIVIYQKKSSN